MVDAMRFPRSRTSRSRPPRDPDLRPVEELSNEARALHGAEQLFAEVDDEYRQMEADHAARLASD